MAVFRRTLQAVLMLGALAACATPVTKFPEIPASEIAAGTIEIQRGAVEEHLDRINRTQSIARPLLVKNADLCWDRRRSALGLMFGDADTVRSIVDGLNAAQVRAIGYSARPVVLNVVADSPAARAGIKRGAYPIGVDGTPFSGTLSELNDLVVTYLIEQVQAREITEGLRPLKRPIALTFEQDGQRLDVSLEPEMMCDIPVSVNESGVINASASDNSIRVNRGLLLYYPDDEDIAVILAHEIGHVIGEHVPKQRRNGLVSGYALWGLPVQGAASIFDMLTAAPLEALGGVETPIGQSGVTQLNNNILGVRSFEREADYIGLYLAARAGVDISSAEDVFEGFGKLVPASTYGSRSHPVTTDRILAVKATRSEIEAKRAKGEELIPNNWPFPVAEQAEQTDQEVTDATGQDEPGQPRVVLKGKIN